MCYYVGSWDLCVVSETLMTGLHVVSNALRKVAVLLGSGGTFLLRSMLLLFVTKAGDGCLSQ